MAENLLSSNSVALTRVCDVFLRDAEDIRNVLHTVWLGMTFTTDIAELVTGYGELWSSMLLAEYLAKIEFGDNIARLDAREVLTLSEPEFGEFVSANGGSLQSKNNFSAMSVKVEVDWEVSKKRLGEWFDKHQNPLDCVIITGYVCRKHNGSPSTLKRNGSDFSASIFGALLKAKMVHIWTDVDGVYSADPRVVSNAVKIKRMSYEEASELAHFGGKVLHPSTMAPAMAHSIPVSIRSSFVPNDLGTIISDSKDESNVTCFSSISNLALVYIDCAFSLGLNLVETVSNALKSGRIQVVLVTQAAFEHSYRFCLHEEDVEKAQLAIEKALFRELHVGIVKAIRVTTSCSLVAAIGDGIVSCEGTAARFFTSLGNAGVNILVIAQGSAARSISVLIHSKDTNTALKALHDAFVPPPPSAKKAIVIVASRASIGSKWGASLLGKLSSLNLESHVFNDAESFSRKSADFSEETVVIDVDESLGTLAFEKFPRIIRPFFGQDPASFIQTRRISPHLQIGGFSVSKFSVDNDTAHDYVLEVSSNFSFPEKQARGILGALAVDLNLRNEWCLEKVPSIEAGQVLRITKRIQDDVACFEVLKSSNNNVPERGGVSGFRLSLEGHFANPQEDSAFDVRLSGTVSQAKELVIADLVSMIKSELC
eukprot:TRINITY_DN5855_c0_g2_i1.p1 TRINITY_DN5855_c0_g2~~TRINITY_DN5855_c0_g2_i1.p1  ORF type:complete len:686 (+),score=194.83 TRINITY_DN5855_c0_g2_i1:97-2058(+)